MINYVEVLGYNFPTQEEKTTILQLLENMPIIELNIDIAKIAVLYRTKKKIKLPDALIAATARKLGANLLTANIDDFKNLDENLTIINPRTFLQQKG